MTERVWLGAPPLTCDLCVKPLTDHFFDALILSSSWACLCPECFAKYGFGLGTGCGQEYRLDDKGRFVKVAG